MCCSLTFKRAKMDDFLEFDEKDREHDVLQKRLVLEKKLLLLPLVPHISQTAAEQKKLQILEIGSGHGAGQCPPIKLQYNQILKSREEEK